MNSSQRIKNIINGQKDEIRRNPNVVLEQKTVKNKQGHLSNNLSIDNLSELKSHRDVLHQHLEMLEYSTIIVPVNIGVKYRPPKIGIEFYLQNNESSKGTVDAFNRSLSSQRKSFESILINDLENFSERLLVHEIPLDLHFFTKEAQIYGEKSYDDNRERAH